jgi:hypothetical protein
MSAATFEPTENASKLSPEELTCDTVFKEISDHFLLMEQAKWLTAEGYTRALATTFSVTIVIPRPSPP